MFLAMAVTMTVPMVGLDALPRPRPAGEHGDVGLDGPADVRGHRAAVGGRGRGHRRAARRRARRDAAAMLGAMLLRPAEYTGSAPRPPRVAAGDGMSVAHRSPASPPSSRSSSRAAFAGSRIDARPASRSGDEAAGRGRRRHGDRGRPAPPTCAAWPSARAGSARRSTRTTLRRGRAPELRFRIVDRAARTVRDFDVEHTKRMHLIVVRRDMTGFQHLHPTQRRDGTWTVPVTLARRRRRTACSPTSRWAASRARSRATSPSTAPCERGRCRARAVAEADGLRVRLTSATPHAGAEAELRVLRDPRRRARSRSSPTWAPAATSSRCARATSPSSTSTPTRAACASGRRSRRAGRYRLFLQFKADGRVHTAEFTQEVGR